MTLGVEINGLFPLAGDELDPAGGFVLAVSSEPVLAPVQRDFLVEPPLNIAFHCFHSPAGWSLGGPNENRRVPGRALTGPRAGGSRLSG